jgi:hypothetical protein
MEKRPLDDFAELIWNNKAISRCKHFLWLVHHERLRPPLYFTMTT